MGKVESASGSREVRSQEVTDHGSKSHAIGIGDALIIGIASTAPACSLAAVIGLVMLTVGMQAVLLASFTPIFVVTTFYYMNCAGRGMGPRAGWIGGS